MAEATDTNAFMFEPFEGGNGKRLTCTSTTASTSIPGTQAVPSIRIIVTNGGNVSAFIRMGQSTVVATLNSMEILPGTTQVFTVPGVAPSLLYVAGITESGTTKLSIVAGNGA